MRAVVVAKRPEYPCKASVKIQKVSVQCSLWDPLGLKYLQQRFLKVSKYVKITMHNKAIYKARVSKAVSALQILPAVATSHPKQILQLVDQMQTQIQLDSHSWVCRVWSTVLGLLAALVLGALAVLVVVVLAKSEALRHLRQVIVVVETCHEVVKLPGMPRHEELEDFPGDLESEVSNQASSIWTMQEMASSAQCLHGKTSIDKRDWIFERRDQ